MKIKAIVFDLYNTLVYPTKILRPYHALFEELELTNQECKVASYIAQTQDFPFLELLVKAIKPDNRKEIDLAKYEAIVEEEIKYTQLYPEVVGTLSALKWLGYKIGVISNLASPYQKSFFNLGLDKLVDHWLFSFEAGVKKPAPKIYLKMISAFNVLPRQIFMTGDKYSRDVEGPMAVGMQAILLDRKDVYHDYKRIKTLDELLQLEAIKRSNVECL